MCNQKLRETAKKANIPLWMLADKFGITDGQFSRWLRHELSKDKAEKAFQFIAEIIEERGAVNG